MRTSTGCVPVTDECLCTNQNFIYGITDCANAACTSSDAQAALDWADSWCASVTASTTSSAAATTTAEATSTSEPATTTDAATTTAAAMAATSDSTTAAAEAAQTSASDSATSTIAAAATSVTGTSSADVSPQFKLGLKAVTNYLPQAAASTGAVSDASSATTSQGSSDASATGASSASTTSSASGNSSSSSSSDDTSSSGLTAGAKAGIVVGAAGAAIFVVGAVLYLSRKRKKPLPRGTMKISEPLPGSGRIGDDVWERYHSPPPFSPMYSSKQQHQPLHRPRTASSNYGELDQHARAYEDMVPRMTPTRMV